MQIEDYIDHDGDDEKQDGYHGEEVDFVADSLEVFEELLLFEGVAVGCFADHLELIFDAFEGGVLIGDLGTELVLLRLEGADAFFDGSEVDGRGRGAGRGCGTEVGAMRLETAVPMLPSSKGRMR